MFQDTFRGKKRFLNLSRSDYQCPECGYTCQVRNIDYENQTRSDLLMSDQDIYNSEEKHKSNEDVIGDAFCPGRYCARQKCFHVRT